MKNTSLIKSYCLVSSVLGILLLIYGGINVVVGSFELISMEHQYIVPAIYNLLGMSYHFIFPGLLLLGVSQFLKYISGQTYNPGWVLRRGEVIIYIALMLITVLAAGRYSRTGGICSGDICKVSTASSQEVVGMMISISLYLVKVLILLGLAQCLRGVKSMIKNSKDISAKVVDP
jgi:hypothetical protein